MRITLNFTTVIFAQSQYLCGIQHIECNFFRKFTLKHYLDPNDFNRVIYHQTSTDAEECINQLLAIGETRYNHSTEYDLFVRCLSEQTIVENEKRRLRTKGTAA